jgi:hypothetical protein
MTTRESAFSWSTFRLGSPGTARQHNGAFRMQAVETLVPMPDERLRQKSVLAGIGWPLAS